MGERVSDDITINAPADVVWDVINDLESYTDWADGMEAVEVLESDDQGRAARAKFHVDAKVLEVRYTLAYEYDDDAVRWSLLEGDQISQLDGEYKVTPNGDKTHVVYTLEADFQMPIPGFLKKRGAKRILDTGLQGLKKRAEARA